MADDVFSQDLWEAVEKLPKDSREIMTEFAVAARIVSRITGEKEEELIRGALDGKRPLQMEPRGDEGLVLEISRDKGHNRDQDKGSFDRRFYRILSKNGVSRSFVDEETRKRLAGAAEDKPGPG